MTPYLNDAVVRDRLARPRQQAEHRRMARVAAAHTVARNGWIRRSGQHPIRDAVGHGLIAIGARLVDKPPATDEMLLPKAA